MKRKEFLTGILPLAASVAAISKANSFFDQDRIVLPPYLNKGDVIGITSPAGYITMEKLMPAVNIITDWGFKVKYGETIGKRDNTFGGTDSERLADFQSMLDDKSVRAIMCARGGYGVIRIIDKLDFTKFIKHPKWIIGFSDITILHCHLQANYGCASIHSKMCNSFPSDWLLADEIQKESINSIHRALTGEQIQYSAPYNNFNRIGEGTGVLIGGNLRVIENLSSTKSEINTKGKILFLEDTGEYLYNIDRMFWNLKRSGKLRSLKGLIIGGFKVKPDDPGEEFGKDVVSIVMEKIKEYNYPVAFDFNIGHQVNNYALKCGMYHHLKVNGDASFLSERI